MLYFVFYETENGRCGTFPNQPISSIMSSVSPINSTAYISMISRSNEYEIVYCIITLYENSLHTEIQYCKRAI